VRAQAFVQLTDNPGTPQRERVRTEAAVELQGRWTWQLDSLRLWQGEGGVQKAVEPPAPWRLRLEQRFVHRLWKVFELSLRLELAYDRQQNAKLQYKQTLSLGIAYRW
jgi:hypothetical protein